MPLDLVQTLRDLVAIPSVNPMGRAVSGPEYLETRVTDYLQQLFHRLGLRHERQTIAPGRENIFAAIDETAQEDSPLVLLEVHQDTVPVEGMTIDPFGATVRDGRLSGRGSCDVKGGMTGMLGAVARLTELPIGRRPNVVLACTVNEEYGFTGATGLCRFWGDLKSPLFPRRPDAAIVAEPTRLGVVVAHKGVVRWRCRTAGRAAHSSQPELGDNAVYRMAAVVSALESYQQQVLSVADGHPLCGGPTLNVGTIAGGISVNTVPDRCAIEIDRRLAPGEEPVAAYRHVIDFVASRLAQREARSLAEQVTHEPPFMISPGLSDRDNGPLAQRLAAVARKVTGRGEQSGVPFGTDAAAIAASGVPTVVFGPGSIEQAHTADEWIDLAEVATASEILFRLLKEWE